jgi:hypothetical protein
MTLSQFEVAKNAAEIARKLAEDNFKKAMDNSIGDAEFEEALTAVEKYLRSYHDAAMILGGKK